jgi:flagellar hook-associated protein 3 FlgL
MTISYVGSIPSNMLQSIIDMRSRLDDLQRQFGSGVKSTTYAGLGLDRGISVSLRQQLSASTSYDGTIATAGVRLDVAQTALTGIDGLARTVKTATQQSIFSLGQNGQTGQQAAAGSALAQLVSLLNTQAGDRYLFSGQAVDKPAVVSSDLILNGDTTHAGLKQVIAERYQADLGANGLGRLGITTVGGNVALTEDAAPFGMKLSAASSTFSNATLTGPAGAPASLSVNFTGLPTAGQQVTIALTLPDGSTKNLTLTATTSNPPGADQFTIGATAGATAANFSTALSTSLGKVAATDLNGASAMAAADNFFDDPPQRVSGSPPTAATSLADGSANTVQWYVGENGGSSARTTASARVDSSMTVNYGMRANEQALRTALQNVAVFAATSYSPASANANEAYQALAQRVGTALDGAQGQQKVADISAEIASAQTAFSAAKSRHTQTSNVLTDLLQKVESVPQEEVGAQILSLQTSLQASLQTTALLAKMSLVNFL